MNQSTLNQWRDELHRLINQYVGQNLSKMYLALYAISLQINLLYVLANNDDSRYQEKLDEYEIYVGDSREIMAALDRCLEEASQRRLKAEYIVAMLETAKLDLMVKINSTAESSNEIH